RRARGRDPARLLPRAPRDRGDRGLPARPRAGAAARHPRPPRLPRTRQPGRSRHPRGRARPRDRRAQRPARRLRPAREGHGAGRALVALRPRARRLRVLRRPLMAFEEDPVMRRLAIESAEARKREAAQTLAATSLPPSMTVLTVNFELVLIICVS